MPDGTDCSNPINYGRYIEEFRCLNNDITERLVKEMRLSFPSGHSSFSVYTMVYCAVSTTKWIIFERFIVWIVVNLGFCFLILISLSFNYRFIYNRVWHGEDQNYLNIFYNIFYLWWHGSHAWVEFRITNIIGQMYLLALALELQLLYWWYVFSSTENHWL